MLRLEVLELAHERVVREVIDRRGIEDVVLVVRLLDALAELGGALLRRGRGHQSFESPAKLAMSFFTPLPAKATVTSSSSGRGALDTTMPAPKAGCTT